MGYPLIWTPYLEYGPLTWMPPLSSLLEVGLGESFREELLELLAVDPGNGLGAPRWPVTGRA